MIVLLSTQLAYKLLAGKRFSIKMQEAIKTVKKTAMEEREYKEPTKPMGFTEEIGHFLGEKFFIPHIKHLQEKVKQEKKNYVATDNQTSP